MSRNLIFAWLLLIASAFAAVCHAANPLPPGPIKFGTNGTVQPVVGDCVSILGLTSSSVTVTDAGVGPCPTGGAPSLPGTRIGYGSSSNLLTGIAGFTYNATTGVVSLTNGTSPGISIAGNLVPTIAAGASVGQILTVQTTSSTGTVVGGSNSLPNGFPLNCSLLSCTNFPGGANYPNYYPTTLNYTGISAAALAASQAGGGQVLIPACTYTASFVGTAMTVSAVTGDSRCSLSSGQYVYGTGILAQTTITAGSGGAGSYTVSNSGPGGIATAGTVAGTATSGTYTGIPLYATSGVGSGAIGTVVVSAGTCTTVTPTSAGFGFAVGNALSAVVTGGTCTAAVATLSAVSQQIISTILLSATLPVYPSVIYGGTGWGWTVPIGQTIPQGTVLQCSANTFDGVDYHNTDLNTLPTNTSAFIAAMVGGAGLTNIWFTGCNYAYKYGALYNPGVNQGYFVNVGSIYNQHGGWLENFFQTQNISNLVSSQNTYDQLSFKGSGYTFQNGNSQAFGLQTTSQYGNLTSRGLVVEGRGGSEINSFSITSTGSGTGNRTLSTLSASMTSGSSNIGISSSASYVPDEPVTFIGTVTNSGFSTNTVYYVVPFMLTAWPTGTSATLFANWTGSSGANTVTFSDGETESVTFTNGSAAISWSTPLTGTPNAAITVANIIQASTLKGGTPVSATGTVSGMSIRTNGFEPMEVYGDQGYATVGHGGIADSYFQQLDIEIQNGAVAPMLSAQQVRDSIFSFKTLSASVPSTLVWRNSSGTLCTPNSTPNITLDIDNTFANPIRCGTSTWVTQATGNDGNAGVGWLQFSIDSTDARCKSTGLLGYISGVGTADVCANKNSGSIDFQNNAIGARTTTFANGANLGTGAITSNLTYTGSGGSAYMPPIAANGDAFFFQILNEGSGSLTMLPSPSASGQQFISNGNAPAASVTIPPYSAAWFAASYDGTTDYWSVTVAASAAAGLSYSSIVALWNTGGTCTGFLYSDGTCSTPSGGGTVTGTGTSPDITCFSASSVIGNCTDQIGTSGAAIPLLNAANTWSGVQAFTVAPNLSAGLTLTNAANAYTQSSTGLSLTSGTTGFGRDITGTVNDASAADGIIDFANVTCTLCTATSYLVDWQVASTSEFKVSTGGALTVPGQITSTGSGVTIANSAVLTWSGRESISSPTGGQLQIGGPNAASPAVTQIQFQGATGSNTAGANDTIQGSLGTGNAAGATLALATAHAGSTGSSQQTANVQVLLGDNTIGLPNIATGAGTNYLCAGASNTLTTSATPCITGAASQLSIPTGTATFAVGSGVTSVVCASGYSCNNTRGTLTIVGGAATTGTIATVSFSATLSAAPACFANMNGGVTFFGIGNSAPTTSAFNITAAVSVIGATFNVNYWCQP